jgi:hypothetical protein
MLLNNYIEVKYTQYIMINSEEIKTAPRQEAHLGATSRRDSQKRNVRGNDKPISQLLGDSAYGG